MIPRPDQQEREKERAVTEATISRNSILIRIPVKKMQQVVDGSWRLEALEKRQKITDPETFAKELVSALNAEDEQGSTMIHRMLDAAINDALENGAEGIEDHKVQDA